MDKLANVLLGVGGAAIGGSMILNWCFCTVEPGERGFVMDQFRGLSDRVLGEGMFFYNPLYQKPIKYDIRLQPKTLTSHTGTKDLQMVDIALRLLHRPMEQFLPKIHKTVGPKYDETILPSIGNEVLKSLVAQYDAEQLLKQREKISTEIREELTKRAREFNIYLDDVAITHIAFGKEFTEAIEYKQVAQQEAETQKYVVARSEEEKKAAIIKAEGDAEAARLLSEAIKSHGGALLEIRRIEAAKQIAETLANSPNIVYLPGGSNTLLNLRNIS